MSNKFEQLKWDASVESSRLKKDERTKHLSPPGSSNFSITATKDETRTGKRLSSPSWPSLHVEINHETARILSPSLAVMLAGGVRCSPLVLGRRRASSRNGVLGVCINPLQSFLPVCSRQKAYRCVVAPADWLLVLRPEARTEATHR